MYMREKFLTVFMTLAKLADEQKLPYVWGGGHYKQFAFSTGVNKDLLGMDCSGLVRIPMVWIGFRSIEWDCTAQSLFAEFGADPNAQAEEMQAGMLAFWKNDAGEIKHVETCVRNIVGQMPICVGARHSLNLSAVWMTVDKPRLDLIWAGAADPFKV
jgi:hypothetical protein